MLLLAGEPRHLAIETIREGDEVRGLLRAFVDDGEFAGDAVDPRRQLGQAGTEGRGAIDEDFQRAAIRRSRSPNCTADACSS